MKATRAEVYAAIDGERDYQDSVWNKNTTTTGGQHSVTEWILFMEDYLMQARQQVTRNAEPMANLVALETMRKITAMGVACMEQNGVSPRIVPVPINPHG